VPPGTYASLPSGREERTASRNARWSGVGSARDARRAPEGVTSAGAAEDAARGGVGRCLARHITRVDARLADAGGRAVARAIADADMAGVWERLEAGGGRKVTRPRARALLRWSAAGDHSGPRRTFLRRPPSTSSDGASASVCVST